MNKNILKNRVLSAILAVIMAFSVVPLSALAEYGSAQQSNASDALEGKGTNDDPILISSADDLIEFREKVNNGDTALCAKLTADFDISGEVWTPIGTNNNQYKGTFDGNCFKISGITFSTGATNVGLFGYVGVGGTVKDLFIHSGKENTLDSSAILVNVNRGKILRCSVEITATTYITGNGTFGVIACMNQRGGIIEDCYSSCITSKGETPIKTKDLYTGADTQIAGISYYNLGTIKSCFFRGFMRFTIDTKNYISTYEDYAITANNNFGTVTNCYCLNPQMYKKIYVGSGVYNYEKCFYLYKDEKSAYGKDIGISYNTDTNPHTNDGSITWTLNNDDGDTDGNAYEPWRLYKSNGVQSYPTLYKTDSRVIKNADGSYSIEAPHFHEIDGERVELTRVKTDEQLRSINEGYICLNNDIELTQKWAPTGNVTLCLNGNKIFTTNIDTNKLSADASEDQIGYGIDLKNGATLTLINCKKNGWIGGKGETDSSGYGRYGVAVYDGGTFNMENCCINICGRGVVVDGGTFRMNGGEIKGANPNHTIAGIEYRSGRLILGGKAKITDNQDYNILLISKDGKTPTIDFDNLDSNARFGVFAGKYNSGNGTSVFPIIENDDNSRISVTGANSQSYFKNLIADQYKDNDAKGESAVDYELYSADNGAVEIGVRKEHKHCICGFDGTSGGYLKSGHTVHTLVTYEPWNPYDHLNSAGWPTLPPDTGNYYITRPIENMSLYTAIAAETWSNNNDVNVCQNGYDVYIDAGKLFIENATLSLTNCSDTNGKIKGNGQFQVKNNGILNLYGGTMSIPVDLTSTSEEKASTFNIYGGKIANTGRTAIHTQIYPCTVNMYGGEISGNKSDTSMTSDGRTFGGGVFVNQRTTFNMYGGKITNNSADYGGGVYVYINNYINAKFNMYGGEISGNTAKQNGGGVYNDRGRVKLAGNVAIKNNDGGNLSTSNTIYLTDALTGGERSIGVTRRHSNSMIAKGSDYTAISKDAACFFDDADEYIVRLQNDNINFVECLHDEGYTNGKCNICKKECLHPADKVSESGGVYTCGVCGLEMAAKVELSDTVTYYNKVDKAITNASDGSTVTVISNERQQSISLNTAVPANAAITLDLNGHTLSGYALKISQENSKLTVKDSSGGNGSIGLSVWSGGTLIFAPDNNKTQISQLNVYGGDVKLYGGRILGSKKDSFRLENSVKMSDLLPEGYAYSFYIGDSLNGAMTYDNAKSNDMSEWLSGYDLAVKQCDHTNLPSSLTGNKCTYCNTTLKATVKTANGKISGYVSFSDALNVANTSSGCTLTLLDNVSNGIIVKKDANFTLQVNGKTVNGTVTIQKGAKIQSDGGNFTDRINCVGIGAFTGATFNNTVSNFGTLDLTGCVLKERMNMSGETVLTSCNVEAEVTVNKNGNLTVKDGSSLKKDITVNSNGKLNFQNSNVGATISAKKGSSVVIGSGYVSKLTAEENVTLTLSGGTFGSIAIDGDIYLKDCLESGYAFSDSNGIVDGRAGIMVNVTVVKHPNHSFEWKTSEHELVCECGEVKETDFDAPIIDGIESDKIYYGDTTFTVSDDHSFTVKDGATTLTPDSNGKYTIYADNKNHTITALDIAGNSVSVTVTVYKIYTVTLPSGTGFKVIGNSFIGHGQEYAFNVNIDPGYSKTKNYKVLVNGKEPDAGLGDDSGDKFSVYNVSGELNITVEGVADITAPNAEFTVGINEFKSFLNKITFGLFFKETQKVIVSADDLGSGVKTVEYLLSDKAFDNENEVSGDWKTVEFKDGKATFDINPTLKASVYVRVTDACGNATVINSDGVVIYTDSEAETDNIIFTRLSKDDASFSVKLNGNTVKSLSCNGGEIDKSKYSVDPESGTITLKNSYLSTLYAGEYTITVSYNPMGEAYADKEQNDAPTTTSVKLTVLKNNRILKYKIENKIYDGTQCSLVFDSSTPKPDNTVISYKAKNPNNANLCNAGDYSVSFYVPEDENYYRYESEELNYSISKREVTIVDVAVANKVYDGDNKAEITVVGKIDGICGDDELNIVKGKANYIDKNVGEDKVVSFTGFALDGADKDNYSLKEQPKSVNASITAKTVTIDGLKIKTKQYDGTNAAEIDGNPTLIGTVDGDDISLILGKPVFDSTAVGENISITFTTPFALDGDEVTLKNYILTQPIGIKANIVAWIANGSEYSVNSNEWINTDFTVTANDGYQIGLTNSADGEWTDKLTAFDETDSGILTFYVKSANGVISSAISEKYKIDKTMPGGTITINEQNSFLKFINIITFGLFFKEDVTVKITANDDASGVKSVEYYKSDTALSLEQVKAVTNWTDGYDLTITAEDMKQFVIYAKITDNAGNVTYISSDGAEFDTTAPEIVGVENDNTYYVTRRIAVDDANLESVTLNGESVDIDCAFILDGDKNAVYTVIATDKAGNVTKYTVTMKPISDITDAISDITTENVKSDNAEIIDSVAQNILDIAAESDEEVIGEEQWGKLVTASNNCKNLQERIAAVAAEITRLTDAVGNYDINKVTSADKTDIEQLIVNIDELLCSDNLTEAERAALEALKETAKALLDRIADAKAAAESEGIIAVKDINKDNVTLNDKDALETAEKALEDAQSEFGDNYTDEEGKDIQNDLDRVREALDAIGNAENAIKEIEKLPSVDNVKPNDKNEVERVKKIIDGLTENEKAMVGEKNAEKVNELIEKINALSEKTDKSDKSDKSDKNGETDLPQTGDIGNLALWFTLLFISGGIATGAVVVGKKKKRNE